MAGPISSRTFATGSKKFIASSPANNTHKNVSPAPQAPSPATHQVTAARISSRIPPNTASIFSNRLPASLDLYLQFLNRCHPLDDQPQPFFFHIQHAVLAGLGSNCRDRSVFADHVAEPFGNHQQLEYAQPAPVTQAAAG